MIILSTDSTYHSMNHIIIVYQWQLQLEKPLTCMQLHEKLLKDIVVSLISSELPLEPLNIQVKRMCAPHG